MASRLNPMSEEERDNQVLQQLMSRNSGMRTADFRDLDNSGRDDRDEPGQLENMPKSGSFVPIVDSSGAKLDRQQPVDYNKLFMDEAGKTTGTTQERYAALDKALSGQGVQFQKNSAGQYRGRVKLPNGDIVDTWLNEGNDNAFLTGGEGTTGAFGFLNRGQEGLDAGGWSFGGGGMSPSSIGGATSATQRVGDLVPTDDSTYQALMARLQGILGPQSTDRNALMALMQR